MTAHPARVATWGADPVWTLWRDWARARGVMVGPYPMTGPITVLVSPWDTPPVDAVRRGVAAAGSQSDVWLVMTGPGTELAAEVLAAGGRGCLPRVPDEAAWTKLRSVAAWWPSWARQEQAVDALSGGLAPPTAAAEVDVPTRSGYVATMRRPVPAFVRQRLLELTKGLQRGPADVAGWQRWVARWGKVWPPRGSTAWVERSRGLRRYGAARSDTGLLPADDGTLLVLGPWPLAEGLPEAVLRDWLRLCNADPARVSCLGCVPPPLGGQTHPAIPIAANARRVAVVTSLDWVVLGAARALIAALRAAGHPGVEAWLTGDRPTQALVKQVSVALQVPCMWVPPGPGEDRD